MSKIQLNGSRTNFQRGKEVTSEWLGPTGINYLEHIPTELPSRERGKPLPEQLPTRSKNTIKDQNYVFQPLASVEDNSKRTNGLQQPLGFGLTRSRTDASMPVFREVGKNPLPQYGSPTSHSNHENGIEYKYYSVNSNSELVQSSRKDFAYGAEDQFQSLREPVDENWEGFSILKKYASKERLEMKTENNRKSVHNSRLIDKYADMNLAKAFFDSSPNKELAALATEATAEHQDKPRSSHLESQQRFSKLNTFGYISSDQAEPEETPETSKKFILSGFLDRRIPHNTPKLGPIDDQSYNRVNKDTNFGTERPTKSHQLHNRQQDRYLRDSDLEGLLGKVGRPTPEKQKRASNIKPEPKSDQYFEPSQPRFVTKLGYFNPPPVERDSEGTLSSPMMLTAPRFQSKTDSQKMPESKKPPFDRQMSQRRLDGGHSLRTVKVDISSLIQRTLIDLKR